MLERLRKIYASDPTALWQALLHCARWKEPMPEWMIEALELANLKNLHGDLRSFDEVFGKPLTKQKAKLRARDLDRALEIAKVVEKAEKEGVSRNEDWFEVEATKLNMGKTKFKTLLEIARTVWLRRAGA